MAKSDTSCQFEVTIIVKESAGTCGQRRRDGIFLANQIYEKALLRFGEGNVDFKW
jgi:hypothetical protein